MIQRFAAGPLVAFLRECWVQADNLRLSAEYPGWTDAPTLHAVVVQSVVVEDGHRRQGHFRRFIEALCADQRFEMVVVEGVQNPVLGEALLRWNWDCDPGVMDFYRRQGVTS
jgi:GNAT superfamily N-acetyltransferase